MIDRWGVAMTHAGICALVAGCAADASAPSEQEVRTELSRKLDPPHAVPADDDIGASIAHFADLASQGSDASYSPTVANCVMTHYEQDGWILAVHEHCVGSHSRLFVYRPLDDLRAPVGDLWRAFGDSDDDDLIDAWFDPDWGGRHVQDRNHDGLVDHWTESFERLGDDYAIEGYDAAWTPPAYPRERLWRDSDFDGAYDRETIYGGEDPDGNPSYWLGP